METLERLLLAHPFLAGIEPNLGRVLVGCARNVRFPAGEFLFREGEPADAFYLIREGSVALELHMPGRAPLVVTTLGDGELVGASWILPPYRWSYDARATAPTRAFSLDAACLRQKCDADHHLGYEMMKRLLPVMVKRMEAGRQQLLDVYGQPAA
jgi:CRP/FNR family cyclic AMP-dependent transcriptional regulator